MGQTVVETATVDVTMTSVLDSAGQSLTEDGHCVMVAIEVEYTVDVVIPVPAPATGVDDPEGLIAVSEVEGVDALIGLDELTMIEELAL